MIKIKFKETYRYDSIPEKYLKGKNRLEIGGGNGNSQLNSSNKWYFIHNYLNIDFCESQLNTIQKDIFDCSLTHKFSSILMIEVLEHFHLRDIQRIENICYKYLEDNGYLILTVPYKQKLNWYRIQLIFQNKSYYMIHGLFNLNLKKIKALLPKFEVIYSQKLMYWNLGNDNKSLWWKFLRMIKRKIKVRTFNMIRPCNLMVILKKRSKYKCQN